MRYAITMMAALALAVPVFAEAPDPEALVREVLETLESAETLRVEGKSYSSIAMGEAMPQTDLAGEFTILLARPDRYRIEWKQEMMGFVANQGTLWNDGDGPRMYMGITNAWFPFDSNEMALAAATGVSGGAAHTIPGEFFAHTEGVMLNALTDLAYEGVEEVGGTPCHKITGRSMISAQHILWIETERPVLRKVQYALGAMDELPMEVDDIDELILELGMELTDESREAMREVMDMQAGMMGGIEGHLGEEYTVVELNPEVTPEDFTVDIPEDATEYASLWESLGDMGDMFGSEGASGFNDKFAVGDTAPDFEGPTVDGETIKLSDYRGQVVLIDFWATWCGPCIAVLPELIDAYGEYHEDGFEIIGVSLDFERGALERFLADREGMDWPNILDEGDSGSPIADEYGVNAIPFTLLLDGEGVIRYRDLHGDALKEAIAELLKEKEG